MAQDPNQTPPGGAPPGGPPQSGLPPGGPPQGGGQSPDASGGGAGAISQLLDNVGGALQHLEQVFQASKSLPPQDKQLISQIVQMFGELMESLSGQDSDQGQSDQGQAQGQPSPMEAGGNKGARPSPM